MMQEMLHDFSSLNAFKSSGGSGLPLQGVSFLVNDVSRYDFRANCLMCCLKKLHRPRNCRTWCNNDGGRFAATKDFNLVRARKDSVKC